MLVTAGTEDIAQFTDDDAKAERRRLKAMARAAEDRPLDPWERYRALNDHCDRLMDETELYDRKTRFALLILGGLNAVNLLVIARLDLLSTLQRGSLFLSGYVACYALLSLGLLMYSISALRPRARLAHRHDNGRAPERTALLYGDDVLGHTSDHYCEQWRHLRIDQLTGELAETAYRGAHTNATKVYALQRVYVGLSILVALTAVFFLALSLRGVLGIGP